MKKKFKELLVNGKSMDKFAKDNGWVRCKNSCCLFDPSTPEEERICMSEYQTTGTMPVGKEEIN